MHDSDLPTFLMVALRIIFKRTCDGKAGAEEPAQHTQRDAVLDLRADDERSFCHVPVCLQPPFEKNKLTRD